VTKKDEDVVASFDMVRSLPMSIKNKIVVHNNNLRFTFKIRMMFLFKVGTIVAVQVTMTKLLKILDTLILMDSLNLNFNGGSK
jgi:hypothetical protein